MHSNSAKTHCPKGHPYSGTNLIISRYRDVKGKHKSARRCRTCRLDQVRSSGHKYRQRIYTPERQRERGLWYNHKLTLKQFNVMLRRQWWRCAICRIKLTCLTGNVDHDHSSGRVRGILCTHCNRMLGGARDNPKTLAAATAYLQRHAGP